MNEKLHRIAIIISRFTLILEFIIAIFVFLGLIIMFTMVPNYISELTSTGDFNNFLKMMFNLIIGIEFIKMLCRHDLDSVVEVLLFAVARYMIVEHLSIYQTLVGVIAIAILFVIRKFLFISAIDKQEDEPDRHEYSLIGEKKEHSDKAIS